MNKEKTSMQMLIEEMESEFKHATTWSVKKVDTYPWITKAKYLLQKEQEQIEKALEHGWFRGKEHGIRFGTMIEGEDRRKDIAKYLQSKYGGKR